MDTEYSPPKRLFESKGAVDSGFPAYEGFQRVKTSPKNAKNSNRWFYRYLTGDRRGFFAVWCDECVNGAGIAIHPEEYFVLEESKNDKKSPKEPKGWYRFNQSLFLCANCHQNVNLATFLTVSSIQVILKSLDENLVKKRKVEVETKSQNPVLTNEPLIVAELVNRFNSLIIKMDHTLTNHTKKNVVHDTVIENNTAKVHEMNAKLDLIIERLDTLITQFDAIKMHELVRHIVEDE